MAQDNDPHAPQGDPPRPFADWFRELAKGTVHSDATARLATLIGAIQETGKPGELVIKIRIRPQPKMDGRAVLAEATVTGKTPTPDAAASLFFVDGTSLVRHNPDQLPLSGLHDVSARRTAREEEPRSATR